MTCVSTSLTTAETRVLDAIDEAALVADLTDLVRVPSVTGTDAESDAQEWVASRLRDCGLDVDAWALDLDALRADSDFPGTEAERIEGYGVVGTSSGSAPVELILQGHVDVVPVGDPHQWAAQDPFGARIDGDTLHGRGACDMKAGVAVNLAVARALHTCGLRFESRYAVHSVVSEEDGGLGALATIRRGHTGSAAVITEPTSGRVITANAGALTFRIELTGRAAHGSTRLEGVSAVELLWPVLTGLRDLETRRNTDRHPLFADLELPYGISVGTVRAGDWASSVPDLLVAEGRCGVRLGEPVEGARAELEQAIAEAASRDPWLRDHPPVVTWPGGQFASGFCPPGDPLIEQVQSAATAVSGHTPPQAAAPYGSDLRLYTGVGGIPTLHYGPGDVRYAHAPREQVSIRETIECARALALVAARRLGAHL